jgi:hypothetical protein
MRRTVSGESLRQERPLKEAATVFGLHAEVAVVILCSTKKFMYRWISLFDVDTSRYFGP